VKASLSWPIPDPRIYLSPKPIALSTFRVDSVSQILPYLSK